MTHKASRSGGRAEQLSQYLTSEARHSPIAGPSLNRTGTAPRLQARRPSLASRPHPLHYCNPPLA
jgi:hypothetical protein